MKKSLIFWFAAVTCAALFLVGCESPTNGESGAAGTDGPYPLTGTTIDAEALKAAFYVSSRVAITGGSSGIDGEVPAGKTLYVLNPAAKVTSGESLTVKGTLDIYEAAALDASYTGTAGYLATSGGAITGTGIVSLPYLAAGVTDGPTGIVTYGNSPGGITKTAGSYIVVSAATPGSALNNANLITLMGVLPAGASLTVSSIEDLTAAAVPAGKTLTLTGAGNTVPVAGLNLSAAGTLIVNGTLEVASGATITGKAEAPSNITVNGTLKLATDSTVLTIAGVVDLTEATIDATAAGEATLTLPAGATAEVGKISVGSTNALTIAGVTDTLMVGEIASAGKGVKSSTVKTYAVKDGGSVGLAAAAATFIVKQAGIVNGIPDTEFVLDDSSAPIPIGSALTITNAVLNAGTTYGISVTAVASYPLAEANLAKVKGKVTYADVGTGTAVSVTIPAGVDVIATAGTLGSITGLTVAEDASLSGDTLTLAAVTALEVNGELTVGTPTLTALTDGTKITGTGTLTAGAVATAKAVLIIESSLASASLATTTITDADLVIPANTVRTFTGEAAPSANVTVNGTLTVTDSLVVTATKQITVGANGSVTAGLITLGPGTWLASGAATTIEENVITLGNNGEAKFGADNGTNATVLTGTANATNTFTASVGTVTLGQSTNKLTITGSVAGATLATGDTAGISVKAGLDITTATVDISAAATSIIKLIDGDTTGVTLANSDSVILLDDSKTTETEENKAITGLTVGVNVKVYAGSDAGDQDVGKFVGAASDNTIKEGNSGFEIKKGVKTAAAA